MTTNEINDADSRIHTELMKFSARQAKYLSLRDNRPAWAAGKRFSIHFDRKKQSIAKVFASYREMFTFIDSKKGNTLWLDCFIDGDLKMTWDNGSCVWENSI